jgi:hypothetical protein
VCCASAAQHSAAACAAASGREAPQHYRPPSTTGPPAEQQPPPEPPASCLSAAPRRTFFKEPQLGLDFQFVGVADYAPYSFRKAALADIGGIDESGSEPGMCGILGDWEVGPLEAAGFRGACLPFPGTPFCGARRLCWAGQARCARARPS